MTAGLGSKTLCQPICLVTIQGGELRCFVDEHRKWEHFCPVLRSKEGSVLLMRNEDGLRPVGVRHGLEGKMLVKATEKEDVEHVWVFRRVE